MKKNKFTARLVALWGTILVILASFELAFSQENTLPEYLKDRGTGIPTSMFGTYINQGDLIFYPFYEFYYDRNAEYKPAEFGYSLDQDFRGLYRAHEGLIFIGYGISDRLAVEFEASVITAQQYKSREDPSNMPGKIKESGVGDIEGQLRWRWNHETASKPEFFSYFETVFPFQKDKRIIGTQDWEFKLGSGLIKGYGWGTITVRAAVEYSAEESKAELGEYAVEYLKRLSKLIRIYGGIEGAQDEIELITDLQLHVIPNGFIRINNAFGLTSKTTDYAPELGFVFYF